MTWPSEVRAAFLKPEVTIHSYKIADGWCQHPVKDGAISDVNAVTYKDRRGLTATLDRSNVTARVKPALWLAEAATWLSPLTEWASCHPLLDPAHRADVRAWHCRGQRVLAIRPAGKGATITAGIDYKEALPGQTGAITAPVTSDTFHAEYDDIVEAVKNGIAARWEPEGAAHKADEHWLQAVLRRTPALVGIEQPALREVAAWRPSNKEKLWGRGYIDLVGVDHRGLVRLVETKDRWVRSAVAIPTARAAARRPWSPAARTISGSSTRRAEARWTAS
jgi:hypothetical protein